MEPVEYLQKAYSGPVYTQLSGGELYSPASGSLYERQHFFDNASSYSCLFYPFTKVTDILMNGIYWDANIPRLFHSDHLQEKNFAIATIADITDDKEGSVPCNLGDSTIEDPEKNRPLLPDAAAGNSTALSQSSTQPYAISLLAREIKYSLKLSCVLNRHGVMHHCPAHTLQGMQRWV